MHEITGVPIEALQNCPLDRFTTFERREWARHRETTEEEDNVYCVLGILDVSMPTSYGEGKKRASKRLQIELDATGGAPFVIPLSQNDLFVGRESQFVELEAKLFGNKQISTLAIRAPSRTGKSQLALELAYRTRQKDKGCSVFWVDASNIDSLNQSYASIARKLHLPGWDDEIVDIKQLVKLHLSKKDAGKWLVIFDNTEDITLGFAASSATDAGRLTDYLPFSDLGSVLFTTTSSDIVERLASQDIMELGEMTPDASQQMLEKHLNTSFLGSEKHEAKLLLQELSFLPLAIVQAAAYINTRNIPLPSYRSRLLKQKEESLERSNESSEGKLRDCNTKSPVAATLIISLDQVRCENPLAADYLLLVACLDRKDIPIDLLEASSPRERGCNKGS